MIDEELTIPAFKTVITSKDEFGDIKTSSTVDEYCWFEEVTGFEEGSMQEDFTGRDAIGYFRGAADVNEGDLWTIEANVWQVAKVNDERDPFGGGNGVVFKMAQFNRYKTLVS